MSTIIIITPPIKPQRATQAEGLTVASSYEQAMDALRQAEADGSRVRIYGDD